MGSFVLDKKKKRSVVSDVRTHSAKSFNRLRYRRLVPTPGAESNTLFINQNVLCHKLRYLICAISKLTAIHQLCKYHIAGKIYYKFHTNQQMRSPTTYD